MSTQDGARIWVSPSQVAGHLAMWAIRQSPYDCPDNLSTAVKRVAQTWPCDELGLCEVTFDELENGIRAMVLTTPEICAWNERKNGRDGPGLVSRYDKPEPDDDFIDLGALWSNAARSLWADEMAHRPTPIPSPKEE